MIGGNIEAILQKKGGFTTNAIGERVSVMVEVQRLKGWLDLQSGDSKYTYNAKLQESTHIFIADYQPIDRKAEDKRMVINGNSYDVLLIDDPMEMHQHLEIFLKLVG